MQLKMRARLRGAIEQRRVRTASGSDRIVRATQPEPLFRKFLFDPVATESVSKLVSEPGAVAMGSNNSAKLDDPVATALGSDTVSVAPG